MGYTNKTTHYELPQYVATDKPKYLTDFNETMQAIDTQMYTNAEAAATADGKAVAAKDVADGAVSSIGTLNAQINGDPTDPSDTGLNGQVSDNKTDIETMQSLIGNGTPTTSNQTIIGAINGLEGAVAPREDGADLANSYTTGEQFARGGSVYTALTDLTAGTAFASLTLNTDYKNSDTLVEQIADVAASADEIAADMGAFQLLDVHTVSVSADGVKTRAQLGIELLAAVNAYLASVNAGNGIAFRIPTVLVPAAHVNKDSRILYASSVPGYAAVGVEANASGVAYDIITTLTASHYDYDISVAINGTTTITDRSSAVPANTVTFRASVEIYKMLTV